MDGRAPFLAAIPDGDDVVCLASPPLAPAVNTTASDPRQNASSLMANKQNRY